MRRLALMLTVLTAGVAFATPNYWAAAYTTAADADESGGNESVNYSGYYCTLATAETLFGKDVNTVAAVTDYLSANYDAGLAKIAAESAKYEGGAGAAGRMGIVDYVNGQYGLKANYGDALSVGSEYLAMLFYDNGVDRQVRVMQNDTYDIQRGRATFSDDELASDRAAASGAWTTAVPEPTGGALVLLGLAALALRRRRG